MFLKVGTDYYNLDRIDRVQDFPERLVVYIDNTSSIVTGLERDFFKGVLDALHAISIQSINEKIPKAR